MGLFVAERVEGEGVCELADLARGAEEAERVEVRDEAVRVEVRDEVARVVRDEDVRGEADLVEVVRGEVAREAETFVDLAVEAFLRAVFMAGTVARDAGTAFLERLGARPSIDLFFSIVYNYSIMTVKLTKKQLAVLNFLEDFIEENGHSPSYREIMAGMGFTSVSAVAEHIDNLVAKGVLEKVPGEARSLRILNYKHEETVELFKIKMMSCTEEEKEILKKAGEILDLDLG